jgi:hypothetical protein
MAGREEGVSAHGTREHEVWKRIAGPGSSVEAKSAEVSKKAQKGLGSSGSHKITLVDIYITQRSRAATRIARSRRSSEQEENWREG